MPLGLGHPRLRVQTLDARFESAISHAGTATAGPLSVHWEPDPAAPATGVTWSVTNRSSAPVSVVSVALTGSLGRFDGPMPVYCEGYQSWSWVRSAQLGIDEDPSRAGGSFALFRGGLHADPEECREYELRSEQVVLLAPTPTTPLVIGFAGGTHHGGTIRLAVADNHIECTVEAYLGGAVLEPAATRALHAVRTFTDADPETLLERWASWVGSQAAARIAGPTVSGWCSWYQYFERVTEADVRANLARIGDWPLDVFQIDDGYQHSIGDWAHTNERFPSSLDHLAATIAAAGRRPGIWWAPFLVAPDSEVARDHPEWLARMGDEPLIGMINPAWGGVVWVLDPTIPEVIEHLRVTAATLRDAGFGYQKLDFTYAPGLPGRFADPTQTPAQRVRAAFDAVRAGAGPDAFLVGCGAPLGPCVGVVDAMRIGPDVAPSWHRRPSEGELTMPGYEWTNAATLHAWNSTLLRAYQHRRLWANDPDCVMLRSDHTDLGFDAARAWALATGISGGSIVLSDDLGLLDGAARAALDETLALAQVSDASARSGRGARVLDRLDCAIPVALRGADAMITIDDVEDPVATLVR